MLALRDPAPKGCTERAPILTRYVAAYLSQTEGGSGDTIEGAKFPPPEKPPLQRRTSEASTKWAKETPQEPDPNVTAAHDSLLHLDQQAPPMPPAPTRGATAKSGVEMEMEEDSDMGTEDPAHEATGTQNPSRAISMSRSG